MATQKEDGSIYIKTEIDTTDDKASVKEIQSLLKHLASQVEKISDSVKNAMDGSIKAPKGIEEAGKKAKSLTDELEKVEQAEKKIESIDVKSTALDSLSKAIEETGQKLAELEKAQMEIFNRNSSATSSPAFQAMESAASKLDQEYEQLLAKKKQLESTATGPSLPKKAKLTGNTGLASEESQKALDALNKEISQTDTKEKGLVGTNGKLASSYGNVDVKVTQTNARLSKTKIFATLLSSGFSKLGNVLKKVGSYALNIAKRLGSLAGSFLNVSKSTDNARFSIGRMVGMSILYSTVFGMIGKVNSAVASGMQNLAQYSNRTNAALSSLMSALTRLKNSFATAFSPILTAVAPALVTLINLISKALTYVGMFIAALTGQKTFTKAVGVQQDYAASLGSTASASNDAAKASKKNANATKKANKENQTYLSGLDEIRQFQKKNKDSDTDTTPSTGNGGGGLTPSDMFREVPIANSIKGIADKIRKLIKAEDWEGLGAYIASGINKGLQKIYDAINWNNVGPKITYFINAFTRTFNSLVDNIDWNLMGRTVGAGINTIVNTLNLLITGINWKNLGAKIGIGINGMFNEVDWSNVGRLFANKINIPFQTLAGAVSTLKWDTIGKSIGQGLNGAIAQLDVVSIGASLSGLALGILTTLDNALTTTDWSQLGTKLATLLTSIDWTGIFVNAISVAGKAVTALTQLGVSFMDNLAKGITNGTQRFISNGLSALTNFTANIRSNAGKLVDSGLNLMLNLAKGIANAMPNIIENIPKIVINIAGVINDNAPKILVAGVKLIAILIKGLIQSIPTLIANIPRIIMAIVSVFTAYNWLSLGKSLIVGIKNGIMNAKGNAVNAIKNVYNGIINGVKSLPSKLKEIGTNGVKNVGNGFTSKLSAIKTAAGKIVTYSIDGIKGLPSKLSGKAKDAIKLMRDKFTNTDWGSVGTNIVKGIVKGIGDAAWILVDKMANLAKSAWKSVKDFFGIHSPSRLMRDTVGKMIPAGITVGLEKAFPDTIKTLMNQSEQLANVPFRIPEIATGKIIPAKTSAVIAQKQQNSSDNNMITLLEKILEVIDGLDTDNNSDNNGGNYQFTAQINRRTLFNEMITEAKLRQMSNGRNPFSLA